MAIGLPEILYSSSNPSESRRLRKLLNEGKIRRILPRAYTSNFELSDAEIIKQHLFPLIARHYPDALISHRSALEFSVSPAGKIYLTSTQNRTVEWPGVTLKFAKGHGKLSSDLPLWGQLCVSSFERALLENLEPSRSIEGEKRTIDEKVLEEKLVLFLNKTSEHELNKLRDRSKELAIQLGMLNEYDKLNVKISAILSTAPSKILKSPIATAQAFGEPYEAERINLFIKLAGALRATSFEKRVENSKSVSAFKTFAFFESYFSNYIEGTTFEIEEAREIIYEHKIIPNRVGDSHDIAGTFKVCSDREKMSINAASANDYLELMRDRHATIMKGRPDKEPGYFKEKPNRAGNTWFVPPSMVKGTLKAGVEMLAGLETSLAKAIFIMFVISEVHPFNDGNGRIARIMMNAELIKDNAQRILIPTVYREDYIGALRKLSRQSEPEAYIKMLDRIHRYCHWLQPFNYENMLQQLHTSNAFAEPEQGKLIW